VAVGQSAIVAASNGTAIGGNAVVQAGATNSVAVGQGSVASAPNTVSFGSAGNERRLTNVAAGVAPTDAVNMAQLSSIATGMQGQIGGLQTQIGGLQTQITGLQSQVNHANSGVAMAMAMGGGFLPDNKRFAVATNYGNFAGQSALALTGMLRLSDSVVASGSASYGFGPDANQFGGRAGVQVAW
jgi:autotransporter adhesin